LSTEGEESLGMRELFATQRPRDASNRSTTVKHVGICRFSSFARSCIHTGFTVRYPP